MIYSIPNLISFFKLKVTLGLCGVLCLLSFSSTYAQHYIPDNKRIEIPFQYENNFIVIEVNFNRVLPLKFVFDTGAEYTILTKKEYAEVLGLSYDREFKVLGADLQKELVAYLARNVHLKVGNIESPNQDFLVMGEDYFKFETLTGLNISGILGANFFKRYVVEIDYQHNKIILHNPEFFKAPKRHQKIPLEIFKNKPYVKADAKLLQQDSFSSIKLLIDTGASLALLLYTDTHKALEVPPKVVRGNIGKGLGGFIEGFTGRFHALNLGNSTLNNLVANYQDSYLYLDSIESNQRNGLIGNVALSRYNIIIDYYREVLYLKPNKTIEKKFKYDKSGILVIASGDQLNEYIVNYVVPGSPAERVGIQKGDQIVKYGWWPISFYSLSDITNKFQGKAGKKIKLVIKRDKKRIKKRFVLEELI